MPFWFFFGYAREDIDDYIVRFFVDLAAEIRRQKGLTGGTDGIGFRDSKTIKTGADWSAEIKAALQESRTLVCLSSPTYVTREFCGQEFQVFRERMALLEAGPPLAEPPRGILPVVWVPIKGAMPAALAEKQLHDEDLPAEYRENGLRYLMKLDKFRDLYEEFLTAFAGKVIASGEAHALPPLANLEHVTAVTSAFRTEPALGAGTASARGPNSARFVFVAAQQKELVGIKATVKWYHDSGGWHWRPFFPSIDGADGNAVAPDMLDNYPTVGLLAQEVASGEKLRYQDMPPDENLISRLKEAYQGNEIVILVVDPWTLRIPRYQEYVHAYDGHAFIHCAVLIPWNGGDPDTQGHRVLLEDEVRVAFPARTAAKHPLYFRDSIGSVDELRTGLRETLVGIKMKILEVAEARRRIEGPAIAKPTIPVPGAEVANV